MKEKLAIVIAVLISVLTAYQCFKKEELHDVPQEEWLDLAEVLEQASLQPVVYAPLLAPLEDEGCDRD